MFYRMESPKCEPIKLKYIFFGNAVEAGASFERITAFVR